MARRKDKDHHTGEFRMYPNLADADSLKNFWQRKTGAGSVYAI